MLLLPICHCTGLVHASLWQVLFMAAFLELGQGGWWVICALKTRKHDNGKGGDFEWFCPTVHWSTGVDCDMAFSQAQSCQPHARCFLIKTWKECLFKNYFNFLKKWNINYRKLWIFLITRWGPKIFSGSRQDTLEKSLASLLWIQVFVMAMVKLELSESRWR